MKELCIDVLKRLKDEVAKRDLIYEHGVDLINYENTYTACCLELLSEVSNIPIDDIDWWLYEDVDKIYYLNDDKEISVDTAEELYNYYNYEGSCN